jgi:hypothetical protein
MVTQTPIQLASMVLFGMLQMVRMRFQASQANGPIKMEMDTVTTQVALMLTIVQQTLEHQPNWATLDAATWIATDTQIRTMLSQPIQHNGTIRMAMDTVMKVQEIIPMLARQYPEALP